MKIMMFSDIRYDTPATFLGGSTAKGDWQTNVAAGMADTDATLIITARPDWENKFDLSVNDIEEHVSWEMWCIQQADFAFINIPADARSPTVLLELGLVLSKPEMGVVVHVEEGYSHYTNVVAACKASGVSVSNSFDDALRKLKDMYLKYRRE